MCGIVGLLAPHPSRADVARAAGRLAHRGPDDAGIYVSQDIALAVRRLSIIDLQGGHQPLSNEEGSTWIVYNGEIVNAPSLRAQLVQRRHHFRTESDTEVIVHAYEEWGDDVVQRLRGMFAFALWDNRQSRLLLARDRFGIKPLYYMQIGDRLAFASEIRPLLDLLPDLPRRANMEALWRLFEIGHVPSPLTAFDGVRQLPAAHTLVAQDDSVTLGRYWQPDFPPAMQRRRPPPGDVAQQFLHKLRETVDAWRLSDVPVGCLLSGGVDSGALAALLTRVSGGPIHTFNVAFAAASHDERAQARATARHLESHHHELTFDEDAFDHLPKVVRHLEAPQCSATSIPIYLLYRACHEAGYKVIMTGEGADELLAGYHWFDGDRRLRPLLAIPRALRAFLARFPLPISAAGQRVLARGGRAPVARYALWQEVGDPSARRALLEMNGAQPPLHGQWQRDYEVALQGRHATDQFLFLDAQTRMVDFINFEVDRMSMASSVEARPPFLDHHLWEFCAQLPPETKLAPAGNKLLLRRAMANLLPPSVHQRPKKGLAAPHAAWWRRERLPAWAEECLHPAALADTGYFHAPVVERLRREHMRGDAHHARLLTGVLTTQLWHQEMGLEDRG